MLDSIRQICQGYYDELPTDNLRNAGKSAVYSFALSLFFKSEIFLSLNPRVSESIGPYNIVQALFNAKVAALASLIYALTTPFFNKIFGDNRIQLHREITKHIINQTLTFIAVSFFTTAKVNMLAIPVLCMISSNLIVSYAEASFSFMEWWNPRMRAPRGLVQGTILQARPGAGSIYLI